MNITSIRPQELHELIRQGRTIDLVDVRTPAEYSRVHAVGARSVPLDQVTAATVQEGRQNADDQPIYVICQSGGRSLKACQRLANEGLNVVNVAGGTAAWEKAGLPVVRGSGGGFVIRTILMALMFGCMAAAFWVSSWFIVPAVGLWLGMVMTGRCPLACALSSKPGADASCCQTK